jgi:hypothetical protein
LHEMNHIVVYITHDGRVRRKILPVLFVNTYTIWDEEDEENVLSPPFRLIHTHTHTPVELLIHP